MAHKIKRIVSVLCLAAALCAAALLPVSGYCENLRFVFIADSRSDTAPTDPDHLDEAINTPVLGAIVQQILNLSPRPSFVVFGGDQAYRGCFTFSGSPYYSFGAWKQSMQPLATAGIQVYTVVGNHELYVDQEGGFFLSNQQAFQNAFSSTPYFINPDNGPPNYDHLVYSFESPGGDAFFAVLDCYYLTQNIPNPDLHGNVDDIQMGWLVGQLAQTKATHKFLFMHPPYYLILENQNNQNVTLTNLWSLLDNNRFDIYFCGHTHLYSRKTIDSSILPNPQPTPPTPPLPPWRNNVVQLLCGTCGAPVNTGTPTVNPTLWHVYNTANTYYFSVVDITGRKVTVNSYSGNTGAYTIFESFTINKIPLGAVDLLLLLD